MSTNVPFNDLFDTASSVASLRIDSILHDIDTDQHEVRIAFQDLSGKQASTTLLRSQLRRPGDVLAKLMDRGWNAPADPSAAKAAVERMLRVPAPGISKVTSRHGWHGTNTYVHQAWTAGEEAGHLSYERASGDDDRAFLSAGSLEAWREGLAGPCRWSRFLTTGIAAAFAGPLLDLISEGEGALFHFHGDSSTGKTGVLRCAASVYGRAGKNDLPTFNMTDTAIDEMCVRRSDLCVLLDEEGQDPAGPDRRKSIAFKVAGGSGKSRSKSVKYHLPNSSWKVTGLTSGETPLDSVSGRARLRGEQARYIDIPVPPEAEGGIFDRRWSSRRSSPTQLIAEAEATIQANYGVALRPWVEWLLGQRAEAMEEVQILRARFIVTVGAEEQAWETRFANKFGLLYAAADLAARAGVAPWTPLFGRLSVLGTYRVARRQIASSGCGVSSFLAAVRTAMDEGRIPTLPAGRKLPDGLRNRAVGFQRTIGIGSVVALDPGWVRGVAGSDVACHVLRAQLKEAGHLAMNGPKGGTQIQVQGFPGSNRRRWLTLRYDAFSLAFLKSS
ncbi:DUF927 domain-containing protein [Terrihabitans rhizophilus]|uniref:DUF927 domain-containing protein n=1 Tax=Terrihabitans rhizophilus TaxID=3092662 RepID=A0ABU4RPQ3_9HYPH|nr:DUF927 domain-containing protein [Terrihabitans sp. PJ23]MDX6806158.1 DUF927 domain-containing protein [Terrihabitans sp. PJ23]